MSSACWNSCLYVYATMKTFPLHSFKLLIDENHNLKPCPICSSFYEENMMGNIEEYFPIETNTNDIFERLFVLRETNRTMGNSPADSDILIFIEIMKHLQQAEGNMKIRDIHKSLKKSSFFKQWKKNNIEADYKLQAILETLGVCGILHTEKHTEPFYKYINLAVASRSSHNSDWQYPVDFWKGKNGIDWIAFHHWFGEYEEIKNEIVLITRKEND